MKETAIALGTFDGVHLGHKVVLKTAVNSGLFPVAVVFSIPPKAFLKNEKIILSDLNEKTRIIKETGVKELHYLDFSKIKDVSAVDFFEYIKEKYNPKMIVCGFNYTFGKNCSGDTALLKKLCDKSGITLKVVEKICAFGQVVSSSHIRELLKNGDAETAAKLMGHPFSVSGKVLHGDKRGREMDFPTVNQLLNEKTALLKFGVYMSKMVIDNKEYYGMTNIGKRPTFPSDTPLCETHLFDFSGDLYGRNLRLYLLKFIREEQKFSGLSELKNALEKDKKQIYTILDSKKQ